MYAYPPPPQHTDKTFANAVRAPTSDHSTHSSNQAHTTQDRYLPSLLHTASTAPPTQQNLQHAQPQGIQQHPLNNILLQTAQFMAMNEQLRKEIEQYANLRVRAASLKGGPEAQVAAAAAAAYFLAPPIGPHGAPLGGGADHLAASLVGGAPFGSLVSGGAGGGGARLAAAAAAAAAAAPAGGRKSPLPDSYKTVMCQAWLEASMCSFGENCRFAHGEHELRPMTQPQRANRKYKTKLCEKYTNTGLCPYGTRCLFIHPDNNSGNGNGNNAYIRPDKLEELKKRQQDVEGTTTKREEEETTKTQQPAAPSVAPDSSVSSMQPLPPQSLMDVQMMSSTMMTSTPMMMRMMHNHTGQQPVAPPMMNIGVTPITRGPQRQSLRPHPSWPLEPSHFFDRVGGEEEEENSENDDDEEHREMMQAAEAVAAGAAASVLFNCGTSTDGRSVRGSCSSYVSLPPPPPSAATTVGAAAAPTAPASAGASSPSSGAGQQQQHLPRAASPVFGGMDTGDLSHTSLMALMDCGTPCSGSGSSSGYLSEGGCCGVITPASGLSSGTASPLDALMLSGGTHSVDSSPASMLHDSGDFSSLLQRRLRVAPPTGPAHSSSMVPLGMTISLPPMSASGGGGAGSCWGASPDPFYAAFDIDKMAREMAKEFGGL